MRYSYLIADMLHTYVKTRYIEQMKKHKGRSAKDSHSNLGISIGKIFQEMNREYGPIFVPNEENPDRVEPFFPVSLLSTIHQTVERMIGSKVPGFKIEREMQKNNGILVCKDTELSLHFRTASYGRKTYPANFQPSELTNLFFEIARKPDFLNEEFRNRKAPSRQNGKIVADIYNEMIEQIRQSASAREFKQKLQKQVRASAKNFNSAVTYVTELFTLHKKLLIVRLNCYLPRWDDEAAMIKQAKGCLRRLSNNKRNNLLFANIAGFLWKLEYHRKHGYYFHFIFFFSDDCRYGSSDLTHQIGQYWVTRLTKGGGSYQNCEELSNEFLSSCIGIVNRTDSESRNKLRQALYYLTMKDQYLRFDAGDAGKRFGRGGYQVASVESGASLGSDMK